MGGFRQASGRGEAGSDRRLREGDGRHQAGGRGLQSLIAFGAIFCAIGISVTLFVVGCEKQREPPKAEARTAPAVAPRKVDGASSLPECMRYKQLHYTIQNCNELPESTRAALRQSFGGLTKAWAELDQMPAEAHEAIRRACSTVADALVQAGGARCGLAEATDQLPHECNAYRGMIERLQSCEALPQQARDALKQGFEAMSKNWSNIDSIPPEARKAMAEACKHGTQALEQAAAATCGW